MRKVTSIILIAFIFVAVVTAILFFMSGRHPMSEIVNGGIFIATVALALVAFIQLQALQDQANADFILKFNREFFGTATNQKIIKAVEEAVGLLKKNGGSFTEYELDDYLGYYKLMSSFEKKNLLSFDFIDETFGHYISLARQNEEIMGYIHDLRQNDDKYYKGFEDLADKLIKQQNKRRNGKLLGETPI